MLQPTSRAPLLIQARSRAFGWSPKRSCGTMRPDRNCNRAATRIEVGRRRPPSGQVLLSLCHVWQTSKAAYPATGAMRVHAAVGLLRASMLVFAASARAVARSERQQLYLRPGAHPERKFERRVLLEVCDPVEDDRYELESLSVDDFALPAARSAGAPPYDEAGN